MVKKYGKSDFPERDVVACKRVLMEVRFSISSKTMQTILH
jgi:hypothetical protein